MTRQPPPPAIGAAPGLRWEPTADPQWRISSGRTCRDGAGRNKPRCGQPAVMELNRGRSVFTSNRNLLYRTDVWWPYCEYHGFSNHGHWISDGQVVYWAAVPDTPTFRPAPEKVTMS